MQLLLQGAYLHFFPDLRTYVERRVGYALTRCKGFVTQVTVALKNGKGSRRTPGWSCTIRVRIRGRQGLQASARSPMPSNAIDDAALRLTQAVARQPGGKAREPVRSAAVPSQPQWGGRNVEHVPAALRVRRR